MDGWRCRIRTFDFYRVKDARGSLRVLVLPHRSHSTSAPLLAFSYNSSGVNVREWTPLGSPAARILGNGNKTRLCPLWASTASVLRVLVVGRGSQDPVFLNRRREGITRFGIYALVWRYAAHAASCVPSIGTKRVSPHVIRHTTAVHL